MNHDVLNSYEWLHKTYLLPRVIIETSTKRAFQVRVNGMYN